MHAQSRNLSILSSGMLAVAFCLGVNTPATAQVLETIVTPPGSAATPFAIVANEVTNKIYVGQASETGASPFAVYNVSVINGSTNVATAIANTTDASAIAINTSTNTIYTGVFYKASQSFVGAGYFGSAIQVIDGSTDTLTTTINLDPTAIVDQIFVDTASNTIYAAGIDVNGGEIFVINGATNSVTSTIPIPSQMLPMLPDQYNGYFVRPLTLAIDVPRKKIYGIDTKSSTLYAVDLAAGTVSQIAGSGVDKLPIALAVDSDLNKIYVLNSQNEITGTGTIAVFDGATASLQTTRTAGASPVDMAINPVTQLVFVADSNGQIVVLDENDLYPYTVTATTNALSPAHIAIDTVSNKIYLNTAGYSPYLIVLNGNNFQAAAITGIASYHGKGVEGSNDGVMTVNSTTHAVYSNVGNTCTFCNDIAVIDGTGGSTAFATVYPVGPQGGNYPISFTASIGAPSAPQTLYVANTGSQPMTITNLQFGGTYYPSIVQSNNCSNPILPGTTCPISLVYAPDANTPSTDSGNYNISVEAPAVSLAVPLATQLIQ